MGMKSIEYNENHSNGRNINDYGSNNHNIEIDDDADEGDDNAADNYHGDSIYANDYWNIDNNDIVRKKRIFKVIITRKIIITITATTWTITIIK